MSISGICYCFVPNCSNNSKCFPDLKFITVPYTNERIKWFEAVGKSLEFGVNKRTSYYCCEAHFDMDSDAATYKRRNGKIGFKVKPGVVPLMASHSLSNSDYSKILHRPIPETDTKSTQTIYTICPDIDELHDSGVPHCDIKEEDKTEEDDVEGGDVTEDIESPAMQTNIPDLRTVEIKLEDEVSLDGDSDSFHDDNNTAMEFSALSMTLLIMNRRSRHYMGINNNSLHVILHLTKVTNLPEEKIMLTLRKIRLNEDFQTLADLFAIDKESAEEYFNDSLVPLSSYLKKFMKYVTPKVMITKQLTCLEIHIQRSIDGETKFDMQEPNIIIESKLNKHIQLIVQIVCGLDNLQHIKRIKTT